LLEYIDENPHLELYAKDSADKNYGKPQQNSFPYIYAYGANRTRSNAAEYAEKLGFLTLFHDDKSLLSPTEWLKDVKLNEGTSQLLLSDAQKLLEDLLDGQVKIQLNGSKVYFKDIRFEERQTAGLRFEQLSDGYKSVMTWVADLVARMAEQQPHVGRIQDFEGIVLVDEIGLHLHPKWEAGIVQKLRKWFPKVQFFFTTHSPIVLLKASKEAVFYRLYKENGVTKISQKFKCKDFSDLRLNSLVTSPLFELENAKMRSFDKKTDELDTNEDFLMYRIRKKVRERVEILKQEQKVVLSTEVLDRIINEALENY
jgi:predicted ATP-binding protein involved in virulence